MSVPISVNSDRGFVRLRREAGLLLPFACLYVTFGATFGLIGTGAPLVFRSRGMPLGEIGLLQIISLPVGLTFLWAPLVDRVRFPRLPHRLGWILASQVTSVFLLLVLSRGMTWPVAALFPLVLAISVAVATMDVTLEALVVETVPRDRRPAVTTAKLVGSSFGTTVGIGLVTAFPATLDLSGAMLVVAGLDAILLLPILRYRETERRLPSSVMGRARPTAVRVRTVGARGAIIGLYFAPAIMLGSTQSLALLDLGVSLPFVGLLTGPLTTAINVVAMPLSGYVLTRVAPHRWIIALALPVALGGLLLAGASAVHMIALGIAATLVNIVFEAALAVPVFNVMYRWAEGHHAATDYAVLFGIAFLVSFPVRVASPMLAAALGWPLFFALTVPFYLVAVAVLARAVRGT